MIRERKYRVEYRCGSGGREVIVAIEFDPNARDNEKFDLRVPSVSDAPIGFGTDLAAAIVVGLEFAAETHVDPEKWAALKKRIQEER